jgi:CRISPR system Cascade subunit CasE
MTLSVTAVSRSAPTTWLVQVTLNPRSRDLAADVASALLMHRRVMSLAPDDFWPCPRAAAGVLYRVDQAPSGPPQLLAQMRVRPDMSRLPAGYGTARVRDLGPVPECLHVGAGIRYSITACPVLSRGATAPGGKRKEPLRGPAAEQWWTSRASGCGLILASLCASRVRHARIRFDGPATVTDPDALRAAIHAGIGPEKSYGAGLLTVIPVAIAATGAGPAP